MATTLDVLDDFIRKNSKYKTKDQISTRTFTRDNMYDVSQTSEQNDCLSSTTLGTTLSHLSGDVDRWIHGSRSGPPKENTAIQRNRLTTEQRSTLVNSVPLNYNIGNIWYMMATILPLFTIQNRAQWRNCSSNFLSAAELFLRDLIGLCGVARNQLRRFAQEQLAHDLFATAMDFVLMMYAMGFFVLSMYQASIIG